MSFECLSVLNNVWEEPVEFKKKTVEVQDFRKFTNSFRWIYHGIYLNRRKQNQKMVNMKPVGFKISKDLDQPCPKTSWAVVLNYKACHKPHIYIYISIYIYIYKRKCSIMKSRHITWPTHLRSTTFTVVIVVWPIKLYSWSLEDYSGVVVWSW